MSGEPCSFEQSPFSNVPDNEDLQRQLQQLKNVIGQLEKRLRQQGPVTPFKFLSTFWIFDLEKLITSFSFWSDGYPGGINASNGPCAANYIHKQVSHPQF